jgi:hypothetical protein
MCVNRIVKSILIKYPNLIQWIGPHGYTLLHHAMREVIHQRITGIFKGEGIKRNTDQKFQH